jgi:SOS-response transcriptional repressor LexA
MRAMTEQGRQTQEAILEAMRDHERRTGLPATVREIGRAARDSHPFSTGLVCYHLKRLVEVGAVTHEAGHNRTYRVVRGASGAVGGGG